ncbi:Uncharacterised protein [Klebsiella oxytoca]|nr:Uncharacterised protein [Klebsiella oxytoca]
MLQRGDVVFVIEHGFVVTGSFRVNLIEETLRLVFRIVQLAKAVTDFTPADEEFKTIGDFRVLVVTTRQRRDFCRIFGDEGWLNQMRFRHFFEDLGHDAAQTPALLNVNADAFRNGFCRIEVIQIGHLGFWTVLLDRFAHRQFFKRLAEIKGLIAVRHFGMAENVLRQGAEQGFGQLDQVFIVRIGHIEFHHGELWVMTNGDTFVTEVTVDFEHALEAANHQTLQVQFRRDAQVHIQIQRVVMGDERTGGSATGDHLHHRGFHFHKAAADHELADAGQDLRTHFKGVARFIVGDQIQVALTIARFLILQAVEFVRQRAQGFGQQAQLGAMDGEFTGLGFEQLTARRDDVPEVPFFELLVVDAFRQIVAGDVQLNAAANVLQRNEGGFTHDTAGHHAASNGDFNVQRFQLFVFFGIEFSVQLVRGVVTTEIIRERDTLLTQRSQLLTTGFQFIIKVNCRVSALCLLFRHVGSS